MTQIQTVVQPSILSGPRGVGARSQGGAYSQDAQQDNIDTDSFSAPITLLSGTTDVIAPNAPGNYVIKTGQANAMTLAAPRVGIDDNVSINVWSDTLFAHTITATALFANGTALKTTATFAAFRGAGLTLRAFNGVWQVVSSSGVTFT